eukprot:g29031.t1
MGLYGKVGRPGRPVVCLENGEVFQSLTLAAEFCGVSSPSQVSRAANKGIRCGGYHCVCTRCPVQFSSRSTLPGLHKAHGVLKQLLSMHCRLAFRKFPPYMVPVSVYHSLRMPSTFLLENVNTMSCSDDNYLM